MRRPSMGHQSTRRERGFKRRVKRQLPSITGHYQTRGSPGTMGVLLRGNYTPASHQTQAHRDLMLTTQTSADILPQSHHWISTHIYTGFLIRKLHTGNYSASQSLPWKTLLWIVSSSMTSDGQWTSLWLRSERDEPLKTVRGMLSKYLRTCPLSSSQSVATTSVTLYHLYHVGAVSPESVLCSCIIQRSIHLNQIFFWFKDNLCFTVHITLLTYSTVSMDVTKMSLSPQDEA